MVDAHQKTCQSVLDTPRTIMSHDSMEEQKLIEMTGECGADATSVRVVRLKNGKNCHIRFWGALRRGDPKSMVLYQLDPYYTSRGAATRPESSSGVDPLILNHAWDGSAVVWHTDGARCYRSYMNSTSVKHRRKQWVARRLVKMAEGDILFCHVGTCALGGLWAHMKSNIPASMHTYTDEDQARISMYAHAYAWNARRLGIVDLFAEIGTSVGKVFSYKI